MFTTFLPYYHIYISISIIFLFVVASLECCVSDCSCLASHLLDGFVMDVPQIYDS